MGAKVFNKMAIQIQDGSTYESDDMYLIPFSTENLSQNIDPIDDDSVVGLGFKDIPQKGPQHTGGSTTVNLDAVSCIPILEAAFGSNSSGVFAFGSTNTKKLSVCGLNSVNAIKYANSYLKSLKISGSSAGLLKLETSLFSVTAQAREAIGNFPSIVHVNAQPFTFHEADGSGYVRIGDAANALASGDNVKITDFSFDITLGNDEQFCNTGIRTLAPDWGMVPPSITGSFTLARYDDDTFISWAENQTPLQMELLFYKDATNQIKIEIPRFIIKTELTDDDLTKQNITMSIGRNGVGTTYKNTYMEFTSPIRITVTNS